MGVDIHLFIVSPDSTATRLDFGRDSEWFDNICGHGFNPIYEELPTCWGEIPDCSPPNIKRDFDEQNIRGYYNFYYISVEDFRSWFKKMRPDMDAGWMNSYDKWLYEKKGIVPEEISHYYPKEEYSTEPYYFLEIENKHEPSLWLYEQVKDRNSDDYIVYYFDC